MNPVFYVLGAVLGVIFTIVCVAAVVFWHVRTPWFLWTSGIVIIITVGCWALIVYAFKHLASM